ncbi:helix-turn-helix domain-containing protein [Bacillus cereus]|uniref:helix-turn-helix domain-containing protein n=1 Tax=Bacillus sp. NPDC057893 TaxID=3346273 RepID=UPI00366D595D
MQIGERIRQLRIHKGLTQGELVSGICSIPYLSRIENGQIKPSYSFLQAISIKLEIDISFLVEVNISGFEENLVQICNTYQEETKITEKELSLLELHTRETHSIFITLKIFGVLITYYTKTNELTKAEDYLYRSFNIIPQTIEDQWHADYAYYLIACGRYFYTKQNYIKANTYFSQADNLMEDEISLKRADLYYSLSLVKQRVSQDLTICRLYCKKAYDIYTHLNLTSQIAATLITLSLQYELDNMYDEALTYLKQAEKIVSVLNHSAYLSIIKHYYGRIFQGLKDYNTAIEFFQNCIIMSESHQEETNKIYSIRHLIEIYIELKNWPEVNKLLADAFYLTSKYEMPYVIIELHSYKALIFKTHGDHYSYEKEMKKAIELGQETAQNSLVQKLANELGDHFYNNRSYKMSAKYFKIALENV